SRCAKCAAWFWLAASSGMAASGANWCVLDTRPYLRKPEPPGPKEQLWTGIRVKHSDFTAHPTTADKTSRSTVGLLIVGGNCATDHQRAAGLALGPRDRYRRCRSLMGGRDGSGGGTWGDP